MDMDLDAMHDDVRVDEKSLGFIQGLGFITVSEILDVLVYKTVDFKKLKYETLTTNFLKIPNFCFGLQDGLKVFIIFRVLKEYKILLKNEPFPL